MKPFLRLSILVISLSLGFTMLSGCGEKSAHAFHLTKAVIETEIQKQGLDWKLDSTQEFDKNAIAYILKNDAGISCVIDVKGSDGEKYIGINMLFPQGMPVEELQIFNDNEVEKLFILISTLYGENAGNIFSQYTKYIQGGNSMDILPSIWTLRKGNTHYSIKTVPYLKDRAKRQIDKITIANNIANENIMSSTADIWQKEAKTQGQTALVQLSTGDIKALNSDNSKAPEHFITIGKLKNIKAAVGFPTSLSKLTDKRTYLQATIEDDAGEANVLIFPTSLTKKEFKKKREHYILSYIDGEKTYFIVRASIN